LTKKKKKDNAAAPKEDSKNIENILQPVEEKKTKFDPHPEKDSIWNKPILRPSNKLSFEQILDKCLNFENLEAKSNVKEPLEVIRLKILSRYWESLGLKSNAEDLDFIVEYFLKIMYSFNGDRVKSILNVFENWSTAQNKSNEMRSLYKMLMSEEGGMV